MSRSDCVFKLHKMKIAMLLLKESRKVFVSTIVLMESVLRGL